MCKNENTKLINDNNKNFWNDLFYLIHNQRKIIQIFFKIFILMVFFFHICYFIFFFNLFEINDNIVNYLQLFFAFFGIFVIFSSNIIVCLFSLIFTIFIVVIYLILVNLEYYALLLLLVYVGAVLMLFLFNIMFIGQETYTKFDLYIRFNFLIKNLIFLFILISSIFLISLFSSKTIGLLNMIQYEKSFWNYQNYLLFFFDKEDSYFDIECSYFNVFEDLAPALYIDYFIFLYIAGVILLFSLVAPIILFSKYKFTNINLKRTDRNVYNEKKNKRIFIKNIKI